MHNPFDEGKQRFAVLAFPTLRTFVVYASTPEDACELVKGYSAVHETLLESSGFTATVAGSWDFVGFGKDGTPWFDLVGDETGKVTLWEGRKAPNA
jgi:hypothetical protein